MLLKHSDEVIPNADEYTNLEFRREICARGLNLGVISIETEWMRSPMENMERGMGGGGKRHRGDKWCWKKIKINKNKKVSFENQSIHEQFPFQKEAK